MIFIGCNHGWVYKPAPIANKLLNVWHNLPNANKWWNKLKRHNTTWQILEFIIDPSVRIARLEARYVEAFRRVAGVD